MFYPAVLYMEMRSRGSLFLSAHTTTFDRDKRHELAPRESEVGSLGTLHRDRHGCFQHWTERSWNIEGFCKLWTVANLESGISWNSDTCTPRLRSEASGAGQITLLYTVQCRIGDRRSTALNSIHQSGAATWWRFEKAGKYAKRCGRG